MGFNPTERLTLAAVLSGLQSGMSGDQAMPLLSSVLSSRDARRANMQDMMMQAYGGLTNFAGTAEDSSASRAYLYALENAGMFGPKRMQKLTNFNVGLYGNDGERSPLYGLVGDPSRMSPDSAPSGVPMAITGIEDTELRSWGTSNTNLFAAILSTNSTDRDAIYDALTSDSSRPAEAYFASLNPEATYRAIDTYLATDPETEGGGLGSLLGKGLVGAGVYSAFRPLINRGLGTNLPKLYPAAKSGLSGLVSKIPALASRLPFLGGAAGAAGAGAAESGLTGVAAGLARAGIPLVGPASAAVLPEAAAAGSGLMSTIGGIASTGYGIPLAALLTALTLGGMKLSGSTMFGMNDNEGIW